MATDQVSLQDTNKHLFIACNFSSLHTPTVLRCLTTYFQHENLKYTQSNCGCTAFTAWIEKAFSSTMRIDDEYKESLFVLVVQQTIRAFVAYK